MIAFLIIAVWFAPFIAMLGYVLRMWWTTPRTPKSIRVSHAALDAYFDTIRRNG